MKKHRPIIDERSYTVTAINGYRAGPMTKTQALRHAQKLRDEMRTAGWSGEVRVFYRDGSCVDLHESSEQSTRSPEEK